MAVWSAILAGLQRERAVGVVRTIAADLSKANQQGSNATALPFLADGDAGMAVCVASCAGAGAEGALECCDRRMIRAVRAIAEYPTAPGLYSGFSGIGWALAVCGSIHRAVAKTTKHTGTPTSSIGRSEFNSVLQDIDSTLLAYLKVNNRPCLPDLIHGDVGIGVYALARLPSDNGCHLLAAIIDRLERDQQRMTSGISWPYPLDEAPGGASDYLDEGAVPVGMAHGHAGVVALLARCHRNGIQRQRVEVLLRQSVCFLLSIRHVNTKQGTFPRIFKAGTPPEPSNASWCWGDPGIAAALFAAGRALKEETWQNIAIEVVLCSARQGATSDDPTDASLCHGAAGLSHILNRFYQATRLQELGDSARSWLDRTLSFQTPGSGVGGFLFRGNRLRPAYPPPLDSNPGFLMGSAGVASALAASASTVEPVWDAAMLTDIT